MNELKFLDFRHKQDVVNVKKDIAEWLNHNYTDDSLHHPAIQYLSQGDIEMIHAAADTGITLRIGTCRVFFMSPTSVSHQS